MAVNPEKHDSMNTVILYKDEENQCRDKDNEKNQVLTPNREKLMSIKIFKNKNMNEERTTSNVLKLLCGLYLAISALVFIIIFAFPKLFSVKAKPYNDSYLQISLFHLRFYNYHNQQYDILEYNLSCILNDDNLCAKDCGFDISEFIDLFSITCSDLYYFKLAGIIVSKNIY